MMQNPTAWQKARDEAHAAMEKGLLQDRVVSYQDSRTLPYLEACIYESMRMFGPGPFQLSRVAPKGGVTIDSQHFPEGTILSINPQFVPPNFYKGIYSSKLI